MSKYSIRFFLVVLLFTVSIIVNIGGCDDDGGGRGAEPTPTPTPTPTAPPTSDTLSAVQIAMGDEPAGCDDPIWDEAEEISVNTSRVVPPTLYGNGQLNMSGTFGGAKDFNRGRGANLRLAALYTTGSGQIFIRASWSDVIFNLDRRRALYNGPADPLKDDDPDGWTSQLNDDKIGFAFEIEPGTSSEFGRFDEVGCLASCHNVPGEGLDMRPATGKVDIWHWKTSRSESLGYVNDQFSDADGRKTDAGRGIEVRNLAVSGNNRSGPKFIWDGTDQIITGGPRVGEVLDPAFTLLIEHLVDVSDRDADNGEVIYQANCAECHGVSGQGVGGFPSLDTIDFGRMADAELDALIASAPPPHNAAAYNALSPSNKADLRLRIFGFWGTQGYFLQSPDGSAADVTTITDLDYSEAGIDSLTNITESQPPDFNDELNRYKFDQDGYCVILVRDLETGHDDDTQFDTSMTYPFGVALMDNDGRNHIGKTLLTLEFLLP